MPEIYQMSSAARRILVIGSEPYALALAASGSRAGHAVTLAGTTGAPLLDRIAAHAGLCVGGLAEPGFAPLSVAGAEGLAAAATDADLIVIATTLRAHPGLAAELGRVQVTAGVLLVPGGVGGALTVAASLPTASFVAELPGFPYLADLDSDGTLCIRAIKRGLPMGVLPAVMSEEASRCTRDLLADAPRLVSVMETSLGNTNVLIHPPLVLTNWSRIEQREPFRLYREGLSRAGARLIESIDLERRAVAHAFGLPAPTLLDLMLSFYADQDMRGSNLADALGSFPPFADTPGPMSVDHRYVTDDVPFGLVPLAALGQLAGVATPTIDALIEILSTFSGHHLRAEGRSIAGMGLAGSSLSDVRVKTDIPALTR